MSSLSDLAEVIAEKDDAITDMIYFLRQAKKACDINKDDDSGECCKDHHWWLCEVELNPVIEKLVKAAKLR